MITLAVIVILLVVAVGGFFAMKKSRLDAWLSAAMQTKRAMKDELAHDGIDEDSPMVRDIVQAARDRGEV